MKLHLITILNVHNYNYYSMSADLTNKIRSHPLYQEAFKAFSAGNKKLGMELMYKLQRDTELMSDISSSTQTNTKIDSPYVLILKDQPIPDDYNRNTFSEKTCITTQQRNLPEWKDIVTTVEYDGNSVYEDRYMFDFTEKQMLYNIKKDNPKQFIGKITSHSEINQTLSKLKKNLLFDLIDVLYVDLSQVSYSVIDVLKRFINHTYLYEIHINHSDRNYQDDEIRLLKQIFKSSKLANLHFRSSNVSFELTK